MIPALKKYLVGIATLLLICVLLLIGALPYIHGQSLTPPGHVYLGTIHFPVDYFYYLSQLSQGDRNTFWVDYVWGHEAIPSTIVGWMYATFGTLTRILPLTQIIKFQLFLLTANAFFIISAYLLLHYVFPKSQTKPLVALFFFFFSNEIPRIIKTGSSYEIFYDKIWFNWGEPFVRWDPVPHHILILTSVLSIFILVPLFWKTYSNRRYLYLFGLSLPTIILATAHPIQLALVLVVLGLSFIILHLPQVIKKRSLPVTDLLVQASPIIYIVAFSLPFLALLHYSLTIPPYLIAKIFEAGGNEWTHITLKQFFQFYGIIPIIGILSSWIFLKQLTPIRLFLILYTTLGFLIYVSYLPEKLGILNLRFLTAVTIMFFAVSATDGIYYVAAKARRLKTPLLLLMIGICSVILLLPLPKQIAWKIGTSTANLYYYLPIPVYEAVMKTKEYNPVDGTILAFWPYEKLMPALTGMKTYAVHELETLDYDKKNSLMYEFIDNRMTPEQMYTFLVSNNIKTVLLHNNAPIPRPPFLVEVFKNENMTVYTVK